MASGGVNVKMGVTGVAQFKSSINQAKQNMKTLDAQLALTEKQYKATGDAETYMQQKTEQLQSKLAEQKSVAANAEKALQDMTDRGVDKSSKAFQDMLRTLIQVKGDMLDTENALNGVAESSDEAGDNVSEMNQQLKRVGDGIGWQNVTEGLSTISSGISGIITKAWKMGEALVKSTLGAGAWADELKTTAAQYEISPEDLQRWRKTANLIDTDVDTILTARDKLKKNREQADKEAMGAWAYLGINPDDFADQEDLFWATGEAIASLGKDQDKVAYATKLFGKSWRELLPLFSTGREEYEKTNDSWSVVEKEQLDNLGKMDDAYRKMTDEWETFKMEMLDAFSGPLTEGMETITGLFKELNKYLDTPQGKEMLSQIGETISGLIGDLTNIEPEDVINNLKGIIDGIVGSLKWIDEHKNDVKTALEVIAGGFALIKVAELATNIGKIVSGFQTLWAGHNNPLPSLPGQPTTTPATPQGGDGGTGSVWGAIGSFVMKKVLPVLAGAGLVVADSLNNHGNDDLIDENGNLTELGKELGYSLDESGELTNKTNPVSKYTDAQMAKIQELWDIYRTTGFGSKKEFDDFRDSMAMGTEEMDELMKTLYTFIQQTPEWRDVNDLPAELFEDGSAKVEGAGKEITDAAKDMGELPKKTAAAVADALKGAAVVISGEGLTAVVGELMARYVTNA